MNVTFTSEQEARIREIVGEVLGGVARQRADRLMSLVAADIEFGINASVGRPCAVLDPASCRQA